jgi:hypothetical protein
MFHAPFFVCSLWFVVCGLSCVGNHRPQTTNNRLPYFSTPQFYLFQITDQLL